MGVFPRRHATLTNQLFAPLAQYLSRQLERPVELVTAKDFDAFWEGVEAGRYDLVHYNQYHYVESADRYRVVAHNEEFGNAKIAGALYVRRDSGITEVAQLRGRTIVFGGGPDAMMSAIVPQYLLLQAGLGPDDYTTRYANSPPNSVLAVYYRQADAAGAGEVVIDLPVVRKSIRPETVTIIARSEPIQHLPWAVRRDMPAPLRERIQALLAGLGDSEEGRGLLEQARLTGLGAAEDADYDICREIIQRVDPAVTD